MLLKVKKLCFKFFYTDCIVETKDYIKHEESVELSKRYFHYKLYKLSKLYDAD